MTLEYVKCAMCIIYCMHDACAIQEGSPMLKFDAESELEDLIELAPFQIRFNNLSSLFYVDSFFSACFA